ncbi:DNA polymerase III subunit beta [Candidatus Azambacteria bacterium]|nr:DNA polymerase III subunit beta [Candidatus Azambacteria bacterium]
MKFTCLKENLFPAIEAISRVGGRATTLPILQQTLIEATEGRISFTTTDLEIAIETWVSGKVDQPGKGTAPTALFTQLITQALPGKISVERKSAALAVKTENFSSTLAGFDPAEFPIIPKLASARRAGTIPGETLARAITQVLPAAATSDVRPELSGLYLEFGGRALTLAATDSFRLAERTLTPVARREGEKPEKVIVPARAMSEVSRIFGVGNEEIEVLVEKAQIVFQAKNTRLTSRLIEGEYPEYRAILPKSAATELVVSRQELLAHIRTASLFAGRVKDVVLEGNPEKGTLAIRSGEGDVGEYEATMPAHGSGDAVTVTFNHRYLLDGLGALEGEEVKLAFSGEAAPGLLQDPNEKRFLYLLMPIKRT